MMERRKRGARSFPFGSGVLLGVLLYIAGASFAAASGAGGEVATSTGQQRVEHAGREESEPAVPVIKKVLTNKPARRTDIPEALLIVMLALIGVVVIARRGVTGKAGKDAPVEN